MHRRCGPCQLLCQIAKPIRIFLLILSFSATEPSSGTLPQSPNPTDQRGLFKMAGSSPLGLFQQLLDQIYIDLLPLR
jgi:hypothetical protein